MTPVKNVDDSHRIRRAPSRQLPNRNFSLELLDIFSLCNGNSLDQQTKFVNFLKFFFTFGKASTNHTALLHSTGDVKFNANTVDNCLLVWNLSQTVTVATKNSTQCGPD